MSGEYFLQEVNITLVEIEGMQSQHGLEHDKIEDMWNRLNNLIETKFCVQFLDTNIGENTPFNYLVKLHAPKYLLETLYSYTNANESLMRQIRVQNWTAVRRILLSQEYNIDDVDRKSRTALYIAVRNSATIPLDILQDLVSDKNINLPSHKGYTPLHAALYSAPRGDTLTCVHTADIEVVQFLIARGAGCDVVCGDSHTPLIQYLSEQSLQNLNVEIIDMIAGRIAHRDQFIIAVLKM